MAVVALLALASPAAAAPAPGAYRANDGGGFWNILPPGSNGHSNAPELLAFLTTGTRPAHNGDQRDLYANLIQQAPGLGPGEIPSVFKDASFGVPAGHVARTYSPRGDVTIVRDSDYGVPHIYGSTRAGTMFGVGYAAAEDRLFFMDVLRNAGRAKLSSFVGGANAAMDRDVWASSPYTEADLQRQIEYVPPGFEKEAERLRADATAYIAGINAYIGQARLNPTLMPGEYAAIGRPQGPNDFIVRDLVATAALIGGIFGKGGGRELGSAQVLQAAVKRFGRRAGLRVWRDLRNAEDPEAPTTIRGRRFPYQVPRRGQQAALPDPGTLAFHETELRSGGAAARRAADANGGILEPLLRSSGGASNALLVSRREARGGAPIAVFGPQVAYFSPQILQEVDVHGPGIDARGVGFNGVSLYVLLGRGRDYAWSATSAGQDIVDTFAVPLCEADGSQPTLGSDHYRFRGRCRPFEVLTRTNSWIPTAADQTPPGSQTLTTLRSKLGLVEARARVDGRPVAYVKLRSTYFHEVDSSLGFMKFNNPNIIRNARSFQRAANLINFTFNWFYIDRDTVAYFNSGANPVRAARANPSLPVPARLAWPGFDARTSTARVLPFRTHPQVINQSYLTSWNNKQARGFRSADDNFNYGPTYRSVTLDRAIRRRIRGNRRVGVRQVIDATAEAATIDLRALTVLPHALDVIRSAPVRGAKLRRAVRLLAAWVKAGSHRIDRNEDGTYEHSDAIRILDAWWEPLMRAEFRPTLGGALYEHLTEMIHVDDPPSLHLGSAYNGGMYVYANKDLRMVLGRRVRGPFSRTYCGRGNLARCRAALAKTLVRAVDANPYAGVGPCEAGDTQMCNDSIRFRPTGGITQPEIPWQNRPTFQQAVQVGRRVGR